MIFLAPLTTLCRALVSLLLQLEFHMEMQYVSTLSAVPLYNVVRMLGGGGYLF